MQAAIKLKYVFVNANQCNGSKKKLNALQNNISLLYQRTVIYMHY